MGAVEWKIGILLPPFSCLLLDLQAHRLAIARLAQRIVSSRDEIFEIDWRKGVAIAMKLEFAPVAFDSAPSGVFAAIGRGG